MRTAVALVSLLLALCQTQADKASPFDDGKRYVYEFKARSATGIDEAVKQFSGLGIKAHLIVQKDGDHVAFQLKDMQIGSFNKKLEHLADEVEIDYKRTTGQPGQEESLQSLEHPFYVDYQGGVIKAIYFAAGEEDVEHNNKKSLATLFQLDLRREGIKDLHLYSVEEDGIGGLCDTIYSVGHYHEKHHPQDEVLNVTKIRKYDTCKNRPHLFFSSVQGYKCTACEQEYYKPLRTLARVEYSLKGNRENYVIEHIYATGAIDLTPFTTNGQSVLSVVNQTLTLLKIEDASPIPKPAGELVKETSLHYEFNNDHIDYNQHDLKEAHYYNRIYKTDNSQRLVQAEKLFHELQAEWVHEDTSKVSHFVPHIVDILAEFNYDDFDQFFGKHILVAEPKSAEFHMLEILPLVGTNPSILYAFHIIEEGKIDVIYANEIIQKLPFYVKEPSKRLVEAARVFGAKSAVTDSFKLRISSRLAYGTLLYKACEESIFNPHPADAKHYVSEEDCTKYVQELVECYNEMKEDSVKSVYLRAIINTRTEIAYNFAVSVLKSDQDLLLRHVALSGIAEDFRGKKEEIASVVAPLYLNPEEDYVTRMYAYETILFNFPSPQFFGSLVLLLNGDHSQKLKSYIYASLGTYSNSTDPCLTPYKQHARHVLQYVEHYDSDEVRDAISRHYSVYNAKYNYGRSSHMIVAPSDDSIFPRELYMKQGANIFGYNFDCVEMGYMSKGQSFHEDILANLNIAPAGLEPTDPSNIKDDFVKKTVEKFNFVNGLQKKMQPYEINTKIFNQNVYVTRDILGEIRERTKSIKIEKDKIVLDIVNNMAYAGVELLIPNEMGMPVSLKGILTATGHVHGSLKFHMHQDRVRSWHYKLTGIELTPDLHLGWDVTVHSHVSVYSKLFGELGYELTTEAGLNVPVKGYVNYNLKNQTLDIKHVPSTEAYDVVHYSSVPQTVGASGPLPVHYSLHPTNKQYSVGHDYFGVGFTYNFTHDYYWNDYGSYRHFLTSFFKKSTTYEDYFYLYERYYAGTHNLIDYAIHNPTAKPFAFNVRYSPSSTHPTTEFHYHASKQKVKIYDFDKNVGQLGFDYKGELVGKGATERKWNVEFKADVNWPYMNQKHVKYHFKRSPLPNLDTEPYEVCYDSALNITDYRKIFSLQPVDINVKYENQLAFGKDCSDSAKYMHIKGLSEKSDEQKTVDKNTLPFYVKCQELIKKGHNFNKYCWKYIVDLGRLDKHSVDIDYKNIPDQLKGVFYRLYSYFRHYFYNNLQIDYFHGSGKENHISMVANISYYHPTVMDVKVVRPDQTVYYNHIYMPSLLPQFEPPTVAEPPPKRLARKLFNYHQPRCYITGKYAQTFDGVVYKLPLGDCYHLAFSDTYWNQVFIYYRAVKDGKYSKAAKVYLGGTVYEFVPHGDKIRVTVDGTQILHDGKDAYFPEDKSLAVYRFAEGYAISSEKYRLDFFFDGVNSVIGASNFYRGKQHGLCGNFDGETEDEFEGPDGKQYDDAAEFTHSYAVDDQCAVH